MSKWRDPWILVGVNTAWEEGCPDTSMGGQMLSSEALRSVRITSDFPVNHGILGGSGNTPSVSSVSEQLLPNLKSKVPSSLHGGAGSSLFLGSRLWLGGVLYFPQINFLLFW